MTTTTESESALRRRVLASPEFRLLWLGQAISTLGDKFTEIAIPILVYNLTGSALQLGLAFISQVVSALLFGLVAGALSDRWDRRRTMIGSDIIRTILVVLIPAQLLLPFSLNVKLVFIYGLSFLLAAVKQFFLPAKISAIPDTVAEKQLVAANSIDQATMTLMGFVGFAAAGLIVEWLGVNVAFMIDGGTFLLSAVFIALMNLPHTAPDPSAPRESIIQDIKAGLQQAWGHPLLKMSLLLSLFAPLALGAIQPLLIVFARELLQVGDLGFGIIEATFGLGLAIGVLVIGKVAASMSRRALLTRSVIGMGIGQLLAVLVPFWLNRSFNVSGWTLLVPALLFIFLGSAANGGVFLGLRTIVQENAPKQMIGRIFNVVTVVSSTAMALGASTSGLADVLGVVMVMALWSAFLIVVGIVASARRPLPETPAIEK